MSEPFSKHVRAYFAHSRNVTFAGSDKTEIYELLHHAEQLIVLLLNAAVSTGQLKPCDADVPQSTSSNESN